MKVLFATDCPGAVRSMRVDLQVSGGPKGGAIPRGAWGVEVGAWTVCVRSS